MKVAVIGAGVSGLGCARALQAQAQVTLYESARRPGGHANTLDVTLDGRSHPVDTGFLVWNERTYPNLIRLFGELGVPVAKSDMSFGLSVPLGRSRLEWSGTSLGTVFAQRRNLLSPRFLAMLRDLLRFNRAATALATGASSDPRTLGEYLDGEGYGQPLRQWYLLPMAAAIWSCPTATMLGYPVATFVRFCHNHGLLQVEGRPQWFTVAGGSRQYVERIAAQLPEVRLDDPVLDVHRTGAGVVVTSRHGQILYDQVVLACHSDQSARLLADADDAERAVLAAVGYQRNRAVLHTDTALMPRLRSVWSSWNYLSDGTDAPAVAVTYLLNRLQPLPFSTPLLLSLNPFIEPRPDSVLAELDYTHPVFDRAAIEAQQRLPAVQGRRRVWFAGAWTGYGFHEDGLSSGLAAAAGVLRAQAAGALQAA